MPHIVADSEADLAYAQGWFVAKERLFQLEILRRASAGEQGYPHKNSCMNDWLTG